MQIRKNLKKVASAVAGFAAVAATSAAHAASTIDISAATTQAKSDINDAGALIIGVVVAIAAVSWIRRVIK